MTAGLGAFALDLLAPLRLASSDAKAFGRLLQDLGAPDLAELVSFDDIPGFGQLPALITNIEELVVAAQSGSDDAAAAAAIEAIEIFGDVIVIVEAVATWTPPPAPSGADVAGLGVDIATRLPGYLLSRLLERRVPAVHGALLLLGVVVESSVTRSDGASFSYVEVDWTQLSDIVSGDAAGIMEAFGWGGVEPWQASRFLEYLRRFLLGLRLPAQTQRLSSTFIGPPPSPFSSRETVPDDHRQLNIPVVSTRGAGGFAEAGFALVPIPSTPDGVVDSLSVTNLSYGSISGAVDVGGGWLVTYQSAADATGLVQLVLAPGEPPTMASADPDISVAIGVVSPAREWVVLGSAGGTRLVVRRMAANVGLVLDPPVFTIGASTSSAGPDSHGIEFVLDPGGGDSFISTLLGGTAIEAGLDLSASWSSADGFQLEGAAGLAITLPLSLRIGPIEFYDLELGVSFGGDAGLARIVVGASLGASLGPLAISVSGIGIIGSLTIDQAASPTLRVGELGIDLGFKMPDGLGIGIDMDPITGGGYLEINRDAGTYKGLVSVEVISIGITAVVIIETKRPDIDGWSMFFALFIELPQIQLGFGFSLNGVGGLAGINRTIDAEALGSAVRSGSLSSILFPEDPIVDAPMIISELEAIFPPANDSYVFGPVVKIGWGTPPIVEAELGIVIAFGPDGVIIAVLGAVTAILPRPELELIALRLDLAGVIDTGKGTISLDASLHDSHIIGFALAGDMALRANFSDSRSFLFSVGGFHPAFTPPAGFPELARMSLGISAGSVIEISFTCYFAITSNTVQFGAALDIWAKVSGFEIAGGTSFDALIKFSPFELQTNISLYVSVKAVGVDLLGVFLSASLTGPSPWHVVGTAEFKVLGISKDISVDEIIGSITPQPPPPSAPDLLALLAEELARADNWSVVSPTAAGVVFADRSPVVDADAAAVAPLLARPDSTIQVSQTVLPLGVELDKYANTSIGEHDHFGVTASAGLAASGGATEWFAPAQFFDIKPKERLSRPSFEQFEAGIAFGSDRVEAGRSVELLDGHAEFRIDPEFVDEPEEHTSTRRVQIPGAELGVERVNAFAIAGAPRFDLVASPTFTSQMEFA